MYLPHNKIPKITSQGEALRVTRELRQYFAHFETRRTPVVQRLIQTLVRTSLNLKQPPENQRQIRIFVKLILRISHTNPDAPITRIRR